MPGFSIPAAEHSTVTIWNREEDAFENMIDTFSGNQKLVAIVSDSYDLWQAIDVIYAQKLRDKVVNNGGTIVVRPDSGTPEEIVPMVISKLMANFGYTTNSKGYSVLPPYLRVIQGDGIDRQSIRRIITALDKLKISMDNIAFGMGGALLQQVNRDTFKFAMKCSAAKVDGKWRDVFKNPITSTSKVSKKGRLMLSKADGEYKTVRESVGDRDELRKLPVAKQQELQKSAAEKIAAHNEEIVIIDTHAFISSPEGYYPGLPEHVLKIIKPSNFVSVSAKPEEIYSRRMSDDTRNRDKITLANVKKELDVQSGMISACAVITGSPVKYVLNREGKIDEAAEKIIKALGL